MGTGAIGSVAGVPGNAIGAAQPRPVNLDADLAKYEGQLSDWTFCPSGKTPEGKVKIAQLSDRVSSIKTQMHKAEQARAAANAPAAAAPRVAAPVRAGAEPKALGTHVDVYA
jgi:hypothetical protein